MPRITSMPSSKRDARSLLRNPVAEKLVLRVALADTEIEAPPRDDVDRGSVLRDANGIVQRQQQ